MRDPGSRPGRGRHALRIATVLVLAVVVLKPAGQAQACSCVPPSLTRSVHPRSGARGFPPAGRIRIFLRGGWGDVLGAALAREYRLRDGRGNLVALDASYGGRVLTLVPRQPLRPEEDHVLERVHAYDPQGELVSDQERFGWDPPRVRRVWFPDVHFRTGAAAGKRARIAAPVVLGVEVEYRHGGGDCGPGGDVGLTVRWPAGAGGDHLLIEVRGRGAVTHVVPDADRTADPVEVGFGDTMCWPDKVDVSALSSIAVRAVVVGEDGQRSAPSAWVEPVSCAGKRRACGDRPARSRSLFGRRAEDVERWLGGVASEGGSAGAEPAGPAGCAHGLEPGERRGAAHSEGPWTFADRPDVGWHDGRAVQVANHGDRLTLLSWRPGGPVQERPLFDSGAWPSSLFRGGSFILVSSEIEGPPQTQEIFVRVSRHDADGTLRWSRRLGDPPTNWRASAIWDGNQVWVFWVRSEADYLSEGLWLARLDAETGAIELAPRSFGDEPALAGIPVPAGPPSGVATSRRLLLAWSASARRWRGQSGGTFLASLDRTGRVDRARLLFPEPASLDLHALDGGALLIASRRQDAGRLDLVTLDGLGERRGPVHELATGTGPATAPRLARWRGMWAVSWLGSAHQAFVAPLDPAGRLFRPVMLGVDLGPTNPTLAAADEGFVAAFAAWARDRHAHFELLRCRARPLPGAPLRLPPAR